MIASQSSNEPKPVNRRVTWSRLGTSPPFPGGVLPFCFSRPSLRRWTTSRSCQWASSVSTSGTSRRGREPPSQQAHARLGVPACCSLWLPVPLARSAVIMALAAGLGIPLPNILATPIAPVALLDSSDPACASVAFACSLPGACVGPGRATSPGRCRSHAECSVPPQPSPPYSPLGCCAASACTQAPTAAMPVCRVGGWLRNTDRSGLSSRSTLQRRRSATVLACGVCHIGSVSLSPQRRCLPAL